MCLTWLYVYYLEVKEEKKGIKEEGSVGEVCLKKNCLNIMHICGTILSESCEYMVGKREPKLTGNRRKKVICGLAS